MPYSYFAKCALVKRRSSSGEIIHGGFEPLTYSEFNDATGLKKVYSQLDSETKLIVIGIVIDCFITNFCACFIN